MNSERFFYASLSNERDTFARWEIIHEKKKLVTFVTMTRIREILSQNGWLGNDEET